jgi:hypothetical protein
MIQLHFTARKIFWCSILSEASKLQAHDAARIWYIEKKKKKINIIGSVTIWLVA